MTLAADIVYCPAVCASIIMVLKPKATGGWGPVGLVSTSDGFGEWSRRELSREMKRASWGLLFYNSSNKAIARYFGDIPAYLRQCSAAGEFAGLALALEVAPRDTNLAVDCKAVDHVWHFPLQKQLTASQVYAGVLLSSFRDPTRPNVKQVKWVRSHRTLDQATSAEERQEIQRNDEVDALAKAALQCHDDDTWEWAKQRARLEKTWTIAQTIGATLALWP